MLTETLAQRERRRVQQTFNLPRKKKNSRETESQMTESKTPINCPTTFGQPADASYKSSMDDPTNDRVS